MAAPLRSVFAQILPQSLSVADCCLLTTRLLSRNKLPTMRTAYRNVHNERITGLCRVGVCVGAGMCVVGGASAISYFINRSTPVSAAKSDTPDQRAKPTRMVFRKVF